MYVYANGDSHLTKALYNLSTNNNNNSGKTLTPNTRKGGGGIHALI